MCADDPPISAAAVSEINSFHLYPAIAHSFIIQGQSPPANATISLGVAGATVEVPGNEAPPDEDADSAFGEDEGSALNYGSVTSSIYNYRVENGRTYHAVSTTRLEKYLSANEVVCSTQMEVCS